MAHADRRQYVVILVWLTVLTALEVGIVEVPLSWGLMVSGLCGLAIVKAAMVGIVYMHLGHEKIPLKLTVPIPMAIPVLYAFVLVTEGMWRLLI